MLIVQNLQIRRSACWPRRTSVALVLSFVAVFGAPHYFPAEAQDSRLQRAPAKKEHPTLARAKRLIENQQAVAAIPILRNFIKASPQSSYLDDAHVLLASALIQTGAHAEAVTELDEFLSEFPNSNLVDRARLMLASAHAELGNLDSALPLLAEVRSLARDRQTKREALALTGALLARKGDVLRAVQAWLEEMYLTPEDERMGPRERIRLLVTQNLDRKALVRLQASYPGQFPSDVAMVRLIELHLARKEQHVAERYLRRFLKQFPSHEYAPTATELLQSFTARLRQSEHVIAAVFPLSGRLSPFGNESLRGVQLALDRAAEFPDMPTIGLAVKDSQADKVFLRSDLYELIEQYGPLAVIGPMRSREAQRLAELAERTETPFLTPSATVPNVRRLGNFLFSTALTYPLQARRIVDHAMGHLAFYRFGILYPDSTYGRQLTRLFSQEVQQRGGEIIAVESYKENDKDFSLQIRRLKEEDLKRDGLITETESATGEKQTTYNPGFDAIFVPGTGMEAALIATQLLFYDIKIPLLGTNGWNSPDLLRWASPSIEGSMFVDGFFLDSQYPDMQDFVNRYQQRYQGRPSLFAAQAYDAAQLVLDAVRRGATSAREVRTHIVRAHDLPTLAGPANFNARGVLNRRLFVLQVKEGRIVPYQAPNGESPAIGTEVPSIP